MSLMFSFEKIKQAKIIRVNSRPVKDAPQRLREHRDKQIKAVLKRYFFL